MNMRHFSQGGVFLKIKKSVCGQAKVIVKLDALFFIVFKPDYRDLI